MLGSVRHISTCSAINRCEVREGIVHDGGGEKTFQSLFVVCVREKMKDKRLHHLNGWDTPLLTSSSSLFLLHCLLFSHLSHAMRWTELPWPLTPPSTNTNINTLTALMLYLLRYCFSVSFNLSGSNLWFCPSTPPSRLPSFICEGKSHPEQNKEWMWRCFFGGETMERSQRCSSRLGYSSPGKDVSHPLLFLPPF